VKKLILKWSATGSASLLVYTIIRLYGLTFRVRIENESPWMEHLENGGRVVLCSWHQQFFAAIGHFREYRRHQPSLMISRSRDGEIIANVARRVGWRPIRGSSSRGGGTALIEMINAVKHSRLGAHVVDGPKGPPFRVKAGVVALAQATSAVIVPFHVTPGRAWHFNSWDRFFIPKPLSRVTLRFGDMIAVEPTDTSEAFEEQRVALERVMRSASGLD
jgi:lysophospholipid acyltransferase (LPLAT)-like uncharacterized protein